MFWTGLVEEVEEGEVDSSSILSVMLSGVCELVKMLVFIIDERIDYLCVCMRRQMVINRWREIQIASHVSKHMKFSYINEVLKKYIKLAKLIRMSCK